MIRDPAASSVLRGLALVPVFLAGLLSACTSINEGFDSVGNMRLANLLGSSPKAADVLWKSGGQYVRVQPQDPVEEGDKSKNDHPIGISGPWISDELHLLQVKSGSKNRPITLFTKDNLAVLGRYLSEGLREATPRQDVTFAVTRRGPNDDPLVTTGRVFFAANRLNIIFGSILIDGAGYDGNPEVYSTYDNPTVRVYSPGSRTIGVHQTAVLTVPPGSGIYRAAGRDRSDWIVIAPQAMAVRRPVAQPLPVWPQAAPYPQPAAPYPNYGGAAPPVYPPAYPPAYSPAYSPPPTQPRAQATPPAGSPPAPQTEAQPEAETPGYSLTPKERLEALKQLYDEGLISEEQYRVKQTQILQGF